MTAGSGILHEEFHSPGFAKSGGPMKMVQLWVNLPVAKKMTRPAYQSIVAADIPTVALANGSGVARIIAGELDGAKGPARTFTPINVWDARLDQGKEARSEEHTSELQSLMRISYAVFCLKKKTNNTRRHTQDIY